MRNRALDIAFSCFMTAFIGGLLTLTFALQFSIPGWFIVPLGTVLSGIGAYLAHDVPRLKAGISHAWHETISWRPNWERWRLYSVIMMGWSVSSTMICIALFGVVLISANTGFITIRKLLLMLAASAISGLLTGIAIIITSTEDTNIVDLRHHRDSAVKAAYVTNPIGLLYYSAKCLHWIVVRIPDASINAFFATCYLTLCFIRYIHSEERRIRMIGAASGVAIGGSLWYGSDMVVVGGFMCGMIGALVGALEYRIATKIFKLVPVVS